MITLTIIVWLIALFLCGAACSGDPEAPGPFGALLILGLVIGLGLYWDLVGINPIMLILGSVAALVRTLLQALGQGGDPIPGLPQLEPGRISGFFLVAGVGTAGISAFVALCRGVSLRVQGGGGFVTRAYGILCSLLGLVASILAIYDFYEKHWRP